MDNRVRLAHYPSTYKFLSRCLKFVSILQEILKFNTKVQKHMQLQKMYKLLLTFPYFWLLNMEKVIYMISSGKNCNLKFSVKYWIMGSWSWYCKTRVTSYELQVESLKTWVESLKARVKIQKCKFKSTSYEFKSTSYKFSFTSYEFNSTSYEFESTSYEFKSASYES